MSKEFYYKQFNLALVQSLDLFNPKIGLCKVLPFRARVDLGMMTIKKYSAFPKDLALLESHH